MILVRRHHDLGLAAAKRLAETMARRLRHEHGGTYNWEGNETAGRWRRTAPRFLLTYCAVRQRHEKFDGLLPKINPDIALGQVGVKVSDEVKTLAFALFIYALGYTVPYTLANVLLTLAGPVVASRSPARC